MFLTFELFVSLVCGIIDGIKLGQGRCNGVLIALITVFSVYLLTILFFRPHQAPFAWCMSLVLSILQLLAAVFVALQQFSGYHDGLLWADTVTLMAIYSVTFQALVNLLPSLLGTLEHVVMKMNKELSWKDEVDVDDESLTEVLVNKGGTSPLARDKNKYYIDLVVADTPMLVVPSTEAVRIRSIQGNAEESKTEFSTTPCSPHLLETNRSDPVLPLSVISDALVELRTTVDPSLVPIAIFSGLEDILLSIDDNDEDYSNFRGADGEKKKKSDDGFVGRLDEVLELVSIFLCSLDVEGGEAAETQQLPALRSFLWEGTVLVRRMRGTLIVDSSSI